MVRVSCIKKARMDTKIKINEKTLLYSLLAVIISELLFYLIVSAGYIPFNGLLRTTFIRIVQCGLIFYILWHFERGVTSIGLPDKKAWVSGVKRGVFWALGFGVITGIGFGIIYLTGRNPFTLFSSSTTPSQYEILLYILAGVIVGPVTEELLFRGIIYGYFRRWGIAFGIIASTIIFALLHFQSGGIPYIQMTGGFVFAISYEIEKNILVPVIIHIAGNLALYTLSLI